MPDRLLGEKSHQESYPGVKLVSYSKDLLGKSVMAVIRATNCLLIGWSMCHRIERVPDTITLVKSLWSGRSGALVGKPYCFFVKWPYYQTIS